MAISSPPELPPKAVPTRSSQPRIVLISVDIVVLLVYPVSVTALGGVYVIQSPSGKYRVGLTCDFRRRFLDYQKAARSGRSENQHWIRAIRKYGWTSMRVGTLSLPPESWEETERLFIWLLRADHKDFGYNKTSGGEKSKVYSPDARVFMSVRHKQEIAKRHSRGIFYKHSPETIERMRVVQNRSDVRARRSASMRKTLSSPAMRDKWAAAKLGKAKNMSAR